MGEYHEVHHPIFKKPQNAVWHYPKLSDFITTGPRNTLLDDQGLLTADVTRGNGPGRFIFTGVGGVAQSDAKKGAVVAWRPRDDTGHVRPLDWAPRSIGIEVLVHSGFAALSGGSVYCGWARNLTMALNWSSGIVHDQANPRPRGTVAASATSTTNNVDCNRVRLDMLLRKCPDTVPSGRVDWATAYTVGVLSSDPDHRYVQLGKAVNQQLRTGDDTIAFLGVIGATGVLPAFTVEATVRYWWTTNPEEYL